MSDLAVLGMRFETPGADQAVQKLDQVADRSQKAEKATDALAAANKRGGSAIAQMIANIEKAVTEMRDLQVGMAEGALAAIKEAQALDKVKAAAGAVSGNLKQAAASTNELAAASTAASTAHISLSHSFTVAASGAKAFGDSAKATAVILGDQSDHVLAYYRHLDRIPKAHDDVVKSSKQVQAATFNLTRQFADVGVTAAMGMNPLMIFIQQAPQIADAFAMIRAGGGKVSTELKNMASTVASLALRGGPIIALALAVGAVVKAFLDGQKEAADFANMLAITGNAAGLTAVRLDAMSSRIAGANNVSRAAAKAAIMDIAASGRVTGETVEVMASNIIKLSQFTGQTRDEVAKSFLDMGNDVAAFAAKHNQQFGLISGVQYQHIRELQEMGRTAEAQHALQVALYEGLGRVGPENLGYLERGWRGVKNAISDAWQALKDYGKAQGVGEQLAQVRAQLAPGTYASYDPATRRTLQAREAALEAQLQQQRAQEQTAATNKAGVAAAHALATEYAGLADNAGAAERAITKYRATVEAARKAGLKTPTATEQKETEDALRKRYMPDRYKAAKAKPRDQTEERTAQIEALLAQARGDELQAQIALSRDARARADLEKKVLEQELAQKQARLAQQAANIRDDKGLTAPKKAELLAQIAIAKAVNERVSLAKAQRVDEEANATIAREALSLANAKRDGQAAELQADLALATTASQRGAIEMKLLDLADQKMRADLQAVTIANGYNATQVEIAQDALKTLNATRGKREERQRRNTAIAGAQEAIEELRLIDDIAQSAGQGLADAFGNAGAALDRLVSSLTSLKVRMAEIDAKELSGAWTPDQAAMQRSALQIKTYGDMTSAAKGFFKEGSKGYKALAAAEKVYRAFEFAMAVKSIFFKTAETAATVTSEATKTAATAAGTATRTPLKVAEGAASMFAALGPFGFPAVAAMLAVMATLGFSKGGGGNSSVPISEERQKTQGSGSVLGDPDAKSESIANALDLIEQHTNRDLEYSSSMLRALRNIDSNIGTLTAALARSLNVPGFFGDTDSLGLGSKTKLNPWGNGAVFNAPLAVLSQIPIIGGIVKTLFGTKTTKTLVDQGLSFDAQTLQDILNDGLSGDAYSTVETRKKKKFFGIKYSDKTKTSQIETPLDDEILGDLQRVILSLRDGVLAAASVLGVEGADETLKAFTVALGDISLKDLKGQELTDAINAVFSKLGDDMAAAAVPTIEEFQKVGEGAFETLVRIARDYQVVDITLQSIGKTFGQVGLSSVAAREHLIDLFGSLDEFVEQTNFFAENFLSDIERLAPIQAAVEKELTRLGLAGITTKAAFKDLVLSLDTSTEAGAEMYAALLAVAPAFLKVVDFTTEGSKDLSDAANDLKSAYKTSADALQATIDKFRGFADSLRKFRESLSSGPNALLSPEAQYNATKAAFEQTAAKARLGDEQALSDLQGVSQAYLDASKAYYASSGAYFQDLEAVKQAVQAAEDTAGRTASNAEQQLSVMKSQMDALGLIEQHTKTFAEALTAYLGTLGAAGAANGGTGLPTFQGGSGTGGVEGLSGLPAGFSATSYLTKNPDIQQAWDQGTFGARDYPTVEDWAKHHYANTGVYEGRAYAMGGLHPGGMRLVGERGPELEATGPSRIWSYDQTREMLGGANDNTAVEALLAQVCEKLDRLEQAEARGAAMVAQVSERGFSTLDRSVRDRGKTQRLAGK